MYVRTFYLALWGGAKFIDFSVVFMKVVIFMKF